MQHGQSQPHDPAHAVGGTHGAHGEHAAHPHIVPVSTYLKVFVALMLLWVLTSACARIDLDTKVTFIPHFAFIVAFCIALTKAVLIVLIFMHVKYSSKVTWVFATAAFLWLGILFAMTFSDYLSRGAVVPDDTPVRPILQQQDVSHMPSEVSTVKP